MVGASASGFASFTVGTDASKTYRFDAENPVPAFVSYSFMAFNGVPIKLGVALETFVVGAVPGTADLEDLPVFSIVVPQGVGFSSASGVFQNVGTSPVPELPAGLLMLAGLGCVARARRRRAAAGR